MAGEETTKRAGNKATIFVTKNEHYEKFRKKIKDKGLTLRGLFDNCIKKIAEGKIDIVDIIKE